MALDLATAETWLRRAADLGDAEAEYRLARLFDGASGFPSDRMQSWLFLLRAANHGHTVAAALVGTGYMTGTYGPERDHQKAAYWLNVAVEQDGDSIPGITLDPHSDQGQELTLARFELGLLLLKGDGIAADLARGAKADLRRAADHAIAAGDLSAGCDVSRRSRRAA